MSLETKKWLTLSEMIHRSNLRASEARRLVSEFGQFLAGRNFGDIIKYPSTAADALSLISHLYGKGWNTEAIIEILTPTHRQEVPFPYDQLQQEVNILIEAHYQVYQSMRFTLKLVEDLMADIDILMTKLMAAEEEIKNLKKENQTPKK
jgi:hypothetical protein